MRSTKTRVFLMHLWNQMVLVFFTAMIQQLESAIYNWMKRLRPTSHSFFVQSFHCWIQIDFYPGKLSQIYRRHVKSSFEMPIPPRKLTFFSKTKRIFSELKDDKNFKRKMIFYQTKWRPLIGIVVHCLIVFRWSGLYNLIFC